MVERADTLKELRLLPGIVNLSVRGAGFIAPHLPFRIPRGAVVELLGSAPTEFAIEFLVLNPHFKVFWCEKDQRIFPPSIEQRGFDLTRILFGTYGKNLSDALNDLIRNKLYDVIITPNEFTDIFINRFGRLARDAGTILLLLGKKTPSTSTHVDLQLEIHRGIEEGSFRHKVLRLKPGRIQAC